MRLFSVVFERHPMVWFLLGLLLNSAGLYIGFEYSLAFGFMIFGWFCCAYGVALFVFQHIERPRTTAATRLSPKFISAGSTVIMPAIQNVENEQSARQSDAR
jgi:hypothetical protein